MEGVKEAHVGLESQNAKPCTKIKVLLIACTLKANYN